MGYWVRKNLDEKLKAWINSAPFPEIFDKGFLRKENLRSEGVAEALQLFAFQITCVHQQVSHLMEQSKAWMSESVYLAENTNRFESLVYRALSEFKITTTKAAALLGKSVEELNKLKDFANS